MGNSNSKTTKRKPSTSSASSTNKPNLVRNDTSHSIKSSKSAKSNKSKKSSSHVSSNAKTEMPSISTPNDNNISNNESLPASEPHQHSHSRSQSHSSVSGTPRIKTSKSAENVNARRDDDNDNDSSSSRNITKKTSSTYLFPHSHRRSSSHHSQNNILQRSQSNQDGSSYRKSSMDDYDQSSANNNPFLHPLSGSSKRRSSSRRLSNNNNTDLPPSMIQMAPKSPILKNSKYTTSSNSFQYYENALTDDDNDNHDDNTYDAPSDNTSTRQNVKTRQSSIRHSHSSRPSSIRSGSSSARVRRKSNNVGGDELSSADTSLAIQRSNSFASSLHSRKSSLGSGGTTAYSTPMNSPGMLRTNATYNGGHPDDYFNLNSDAYVNNVNLNGEYSGGHANSNMDNIPTAIPSTSAVHDLKGNGSKDRYPGGGGGAISDHNEPFDSQENMTENSPNLNDSTTALKKKKNYKPIDIDETIQKLLDAGYAAKRTKNVCLKNYEILQICHLAREMFLSQPSLLELSPPVKIVGDVHGQYGDLLRLFTKCGFPPSANYLFLGDYVDRGKQSLETILLLLCYKIKYPENFFLLRGNHECANVTRVYGFYDECKRRCNIKTWKTFIDTFNTLPLAAIVAGKIFCVHGGLSPVLNSMDEIRHVSRPTDVPDFGLINDLLWSDPTDSPNEWEDNERGVSYCYNKVAINKFLNKFGFDLVCRAHMVVEDGYEFFNDRSLVTVFSAPNYCGEFDNWGAVMSVSEGLLCSFELLDPLDSAALKQVMKKGRQERKLANQQQIQQLQD
ncbi:hypothetical protein NCAS_0H02660 [Naumovozyma castellii]|uniref:Serine/threonine-protein phosphatase n=1 Tax=Naumovozyma castellii TaxID=27288 RepID=G0VJ97_NAUCA|nr:hypothetical protein NCAS_0H02660 [Naumovozyma castellii CBS 4309]CCC71576.1 hypothetical protein NCAS_0H02660 [Naumovozyma castellii CBS 4309]